MEIQNNYIDIDNTPFELQRETTPWKLKNNQPRIAGVSSFGFGGVNAHVVVEESIQSPKKQSSKIKINDSFIIPLSAKNESRLREIVSNLIRYVDANLGIENKNKLLRDVAYTLQIGRQAMEERLAFVVNDIEDFKNQLKSYQKINLDKVLRGNTKKGKPDFILEELGGIAYLKSAIADKQTKILAQLWVKGVIIDWNLLYNKSNRPNKISVPTYPFAKQKYWIAAIEEIPPLSIDKLHPLLHSNESNLEEQKYTSIYNGKEPFLSNHKVQGEKVFPGVAYLELAREAGKRSLNKEITAIKDITWLAPIRVNEQAKTIQVSIFKEGNVYGYEVYSLNEENSEEVIHAQGKLNVDENPIVEAMDIETIKNRLTGKKSGAVCYKIFDELGLNYGATFQGIDTLYHSNNEALSELCLPINDDYILQPGILDSALQTCLGISLGIEPLPLTLPFSVKEVNIYGNVSTTHWVYARKSNTTKQTDKVTKFHIDLLSKTGEVLLSFKDFVSLPLNRSKKAVPKSSIKSSLPVLSTDPELQYYTVDWREKKINKRLKSIQNITIVLADGSVSLAEKLTIELECEVHAINENTETNFYLKLQELVQGRLQLKDSTQFIILYKNKEVVNSGFIGGLLKTASLESPKFKSKTIGLENLSIKEINNLIELLEEEKQDESIEVKYELGKRFVKELSSLNLNKDKIK
ncbi:MAG: polyketide synthase dehydratase domain-containing protein, partial [Polaribacter sp.]